MRGSASQWSCSCIWLGILPRGRTARLNEIARAEQLLLEAIESDPNNSMAHSNMGLLRRVQNRLIEARIEFEAATSLRANDPYTHRQLAWTLLLLGQPRAGLVQAEKILRLSPRDPTIWGTYLILGWCQLLLSRIDPTIELLIKSRAANPRPWVTHLGLAAALALKGRPRWGESGDRGVTQSQSGGQLAWPIPCLSPLGQPAALGALRKHGGGWPAPSRFPRRVTARNVSLRRQQRGRIRLERLRAITSGVAPHGLPRSDLEHRKLPLDGLRLALR
jgi:tetratricopeptide (TPR) repeat protein